MIKNLQGTGVALVTPLNEKLEVDFKGLAKLLQTSNEGSVDYWVVHGTTGESVTTQPAEKKQILEFIQANNPRNLPIAYGLGGNDTSELLRQIDKIDFKGIDAVLSVSPYYNRPSQEGIYLHYKALADICPVPLILYNVPSRTGSTIAPETVIRLSKHANIIGIKEASGNLVACIEIARDKPADFLLISGDDILTIPMIAVGGVGVISTIANAFPKRMSDMVRAALNNDYKLAREHQSKLLTFHHLIAQGGNPVVTKQILAALDICKNYVRLPLAPVDTPFIERIQQEVLRSCYHVISTF
ncbi:MAG: 4-hydroxy-tetrahydrodipicolinate synthase [Candidatus Amoebophilus sp. 36-38]|nr:MAG: 4-hydroxy-tetrahydrodipicolinate synthase [Candidatus Amoebophilus sp. 36-38]